MLVMTRRAMLAAGAALALVPGSHASAAEKVRIGLSSKGLLFMPSLVADAMGYFKDEGVDVELAVLGGANKVYTALVAGELEMSVSSSVSILKARSSQTDLMMVGTAMNQHGSNIVVSKEWAAKFNITDSSSYEDRLKALKGITVGTSSVGGGSDQLVRLLAEEAGLDPDRDMTLTVLAVGDATLAAFAQRRVDAITHSSPVAVKAIRDYDGMMLFHLSAGQVPIYDGFLYLAYSVSEAWLKEHRDAGLKTLAALQRAHRVIRDDSQRDIIRKAVKDKFYPEMDEALFANSWADYATAFPQTIAMDQSMVDRVLKMSDRLQPDEPIDPAIAKQAWADSYVNNLQK